MDSKRIKELSGRLPIKVSVSCKRGWIWGYCRQAIRQKANDKNITYMFLFIIIAFVLNAILRISSLIPLFFVDNNTY